MGVNAVLATRKENAARTIYNENRKGYGERDCTANRVRIIKDIDSLLLGAVNTVLKIERVADLRDRPPEEKI
jgi:hypothetical protein